MVRKRKKYRDHKADAKRRGIQFLLSFDGWMKIWLDSGHWNKRGRGRGKYHMARFGDKGPYAIGNVKIITHEENSKELVYTDTAATRLKMSNSHLGRKFTSENRANLST